MNTLFILFLIPFLPLSTAFLYSSLSKNSAAAWAKLPSLINLTVLGDCLTDPLKYSENKANCNSFENLEKLGIKSCISSSLISTSSAKFFCACSKVILSPFLILALFLPYPIVKFFSSSNALVAYKNGSPS